MTNLADVDWSKIPAPEDDGAARHLPGMPLASVPLAATAGSTVDLSTLRGRAVIYAYPRTGEPDKPLPEGWDMIPGARGCTAQSCAFRDHFAELRQGGVAHLYGLSTQDTAYQREAAERLHLGFERGLLVQTGLEHAPLVHRVGDQTFLLARYDQRRLENVLHRLPEFRRNGEPSLGVDGVFVEPPKHPCSLG